MSPAVLRNQLLNGVAVLNDYLAAGFVERDWPAMVRATMKGVPTSAVIRPLLLASVDAASALLMLAHGKTIANFFIPGLEDRAILIQNHKKETVALT